MDNYVKKSGDTMSGLLQTTSYFRTNGRTTRIVEANSADNSTTWGTFEVNKNSDTETASYMFAFNPTDNKKNAAISIHVSGDKSWAQCPNSKFNYSIATTDSHGDTWIRFGNGIQICWGRVNVNGAITATNVKVNFPQPFSALPSVLSCDNANAGTNASIRVGWESTVSFTIGTRAGESSTGATNWIAIGYWY